MGGSGYADRQTTESSAEIEAADCDDALSDGGKNKWNTENATTTAAAAKQKNAREFSVGKYHLC